MERTKLQIAKRAGWLCSDPLCRRETVGSNADGDGEINVGTAAHICAATPEGPRYDASQTRAQRRSAENGIWLCRIHGTAVDARDSKFTVELLQEWKTRAQADSRHRVLHPDVRAAEVQAPTKSELSTRLRAAAVADLDVFRRMDKWPSTVIALTLEVDGLSDSVSASALATALITLDDLILVAPPGMGKTTTLFQIAEAALLNGNASPIIIFLGDWSADGTTLLESILKRPAFREISENDLRAVATKPGVILLLDGWNEVDGTARKRLAVQIARLQAELPELSLLISTRKQALDVPVNGMRINLLPLSETQQLDIARAIRGDAGVRIIDHAWRTAGVRELVTIPLYLTALLTLPEGAPFPTTKEEVLRCFVAVHEEDIHRFETLAEVTHGLHQRFLEDLAATAVRATSTTIVEAVARKSVSETNDALWAERQISDKRQPNMVLAALVSYHVLVCVGDPTGYSFQHQQFLEWYGSHFVQRLMLASVGNSVSRDKLKLEVFNQPAWEESILFACERLAHGDPEQQKACGAAILAAFEVDPILAAEMVFRSTDLIWALVGSTIQGYIGQWHAPGKVDRALRFMIGSGRPEFLEQVWPLIAHEHNQVSLSALRASRRFRPSLLGTDVAKRIAALSQDVRKNILCEIASNSGMDGLDLAATIAKNDPAPEVKAAVINALAFRRADRHVADVLRGADEKTFDLVARNGLADEVPDEHVKKGIEAARGRQLKEGISVYVRLRAIIHAQGNEDMSAELTAIIAEMKIDEKRDVEVQLLYEARSRYSRAIADGLLQRVRAGSSLFFGTDDFLASAGFSLDDDSLLYIALSETRPHDDRAEAAASVLGPHAARRMVEAALEVSKQVRDANGKYDEAVADRYRDLRARVAHMPGASLIAAMRTLSAHAGNEEMAYLAELISRHPNDEDDRGRPFDADALATIGALAKEWGNRMLGSGNATRGQLASVATLVGIAPSVSLLPLLKQLVDEDLRCYRAFREEANATGWRPGKATNEARFSYTNQYQHAFDAINSPETAALMREYLLDLNFGQPAARVLAAQWIAANEPDDDHNFRWRANFSRVKEKRAARASDPTTTSAEADAIFSAIDLLITNETSEDQKKHAVALGIVAARLPHGQREATIQELISLAPWRQRAELLLNLLLSGDNIDAKIVRGGLTEMFEEAKTRTWILSEGHDLRAWLRLLPFVSPPEEAFAIVNGLPVAQRGIDQLEEMIAGFGSAPGIDAENVLFLLAETNTKFYANRDWCTAVVGRGTLSASRRFVDLAANGVFEGGRMEQWHMVHQLSGLIDEHPELRSQIYQLLQGGAKTPGLTLLANAFAEHPDADGLLLLIKIEAEYGHPFVSQRTIKSVVTEEVPSENWKGAYNIAPVPAIELRRALLAMTTDGGPTDVAARYLNEIDKIRDEYGTPDSEPRHPDLALGKSWPIMRPASG